MKSAFFEYTVATSGLQVARAGLTVTSNNVSNASNKGYSRQYIEQRASKPMTYYNGRGMYGTGADVYGVGQYRSAYLDKKYWHENSIRGEYTLKASQLSLMETILGGMSESGINSLFDGFFMSMQDLTQNAGNATYRTNVITSAQTLAKQLNSAVESLQKQQRDINSEVASMVQVVNSLGNQIASINKQIALFELDGSRANDLRDQRTRLIDQLSQYVNVEVRENELNEEYALGMWPEPEDRCKSNKQLTILINGEEFVNHDSVAGLRVEERTEKLNPSDVGGLYDIYFNNSNKQLDLYNSSLTGELKGLIDLRDGNNSYYAETSKTTLEDMDPDNYIKLTLHDLNKLDLGETGYIELTDARTGARTRYSYRDLEYGEDADGNVTVTVSVEKPKNYPDFVNMASKASVSIGQSTPYKGIPHYINKLNELVRNFARAINEGLDANGSPIPGVAGHINGYDMYNNTGNLFFTYDKGITTGSINYALMTAQNFMVNPELLKDPLKLAASDVVNEDGGESNNKLILQLIELKSYRSLFREGKLEDFIIGMTSELGIDKRQADQFETNYGEVVTYVDNQRESYSGVNIDEEMVAMIRYQQLYQAAAKLVNIIDSIYDTCINRLGVR